MCCQCVVRLKEKIRNLLKTVVFYEQFFILRLMNKQGGSAFCVRQ